MRHQAVMGVVAVACVAVVSAPMLGARGGVHHRGGRPADRHQYLAGVDFTADPMVAETATAAAALSRAFTDSGALIFPKGPPAASDDGVYSPFIGLNPPSLGPLRTALRQLTSFDRAPPEAPLPAPPAPPAQTRGLVQAIGEETPVPPPPEPPVTPPDDPPPPVIVVTPVTPVTPIETVTPPAPPAPQDQPPPAPVVLVQTPTVAPPAAIPEPGTWAMLLLGFAAVGAAIRRRRDRPPAKDGC